LKNDKFSEQDVDVLLQFAQEDQIDSLRVGKKTLIAVETILKNNENKSDTSLKLPIMIRSANPLTFFCLLYTGSALVLD